MHNVLHTPVPTKLTPLALCAICEAAFTPYGACVCSHGWIRTSKTWAPLWTDMQGALYLVPSLSWDKLQAHSILLQLLVQYKVLA